jgi:hypothetical protein
VRLDYVQTNEQITNIFTKEMDRQKFEKFKYQMGLRQNMFLAKRECGDWIARKFFTMNGILS